MQAMSTVLRPRKSAKLPPRKAPSNSPRVLALNTNPNRDELGANSKPIPDAHTPAAWISKPSHKEAKKQNKMVRLALLGSPEFIPSFAPKDLSKRVFPRHVR